MTIRIAAILALAPLAGACATTPEGAAPAPAPAGVARTVYVAGETRPCTGVGPMTCLQVRTSPSGPWQLFYQSIAGFDHRPGYEYTLRIIETPVPNPPADASSIRWTLDRVIERKPVAAAQ